MRGPSTDLKDPFQVPYRVPGAGLKGERQLVELTCQGGSDSNWPVESKPQFLSFENTKIAVKIAALLKFHEQILPPPIAGHGGSCPGRIVAGFFFTIKG